MNAGEQVTLPVTREFLRRTAGFGVHESAMQPAFGMAESTCMTYQRRTETAGVHRVLKSSLEGRLQETDLEDSTTVAFTDLGPPSPGFQIRIVDEGNGLLPEGVIGRFQIRGPSVTPGYLNNQQANTEAFMGGGWFNSGDLGFIRHGRLTLTGREKEMVVVRGANIYCYEIEDVVNSVEGVDATFAAACGVADAATGTEGLAIFFVPAAGTDAQKPTPDLIRSIRTTIGSSLGLSALHVVPLSRQEFPKTTSGKIQRTLLKQRLLQGEYQARLAQIDLVMESVNTIPNWFHRVVWRRRDRQRPSAQDRIDGTTVVLRTGSALSQAVCRAIARSGRCIEVQPGEQFAQRSAERYVIDPAQAEDYRQLLRAIRESHGGIDRVVYLWSHDRREPVVDVEGLAQTRQLSVSGPLFLVQALEAIRTDGDSSTQLVVVSRKTRAVLPGERIAWEWSGCSGLLASVTQELPWIVARQVDLDEQDDPEHASHVLEELSARREREVVYREGRRWVPRLEHVDLRGRAGERSPVRHGGSYVVTGGLGGLGVIVCGHLLQQHAARLLVVGRTPLVEAHGAPAQDASELTANRLSALRRLQHLGGEIQYVALDVADALALERAVQQAEQRWLCRLDGVFHLAGLLDERLAIEETRESFAASVRSKVLGTWALARLLRERPDSLLVAFSSVNTFFGGVRAGAYAAGNQFLESYCLDRRAAAEARTFCLSWSMWDGSASAPVIR